MNIYDNDFLQEQDIIEISFPESSKGNFGTHCNYVAEVRRNPVFLADMVIWWGGNKMWVLDSQYETQDKCKEIKDLRDRIEKVFRKTDEDTYVCMWKKEEKENIL